MPSTLAAPPLPPKRSTPPSDRHSPGPAIWCLTTSPLIAHRRDVEPAPKIRPLLIGRLGLATVCSCFFQTPAQPVTVLRQRCLKGQSARRLSHTSVLRKR